MPPSKSKKRRPKHAKLISHFRKLLKRFSKQLKVAFGKKDISLLRKKYDEYNHPTCHDKKSPMDQAFREMVFFKIRNDVKKIGALIRFSVEAVRVDIVSVTIPVVLLSDVFERSTVTVCEQIFEVVEELVDVWKEDIFFSSCKNNILRMCNDLLRRLSRSQHTVFCGRILLFLSRFFPFSERSGLNIVSEFNSDNITEYDVEDKEFETSNSVEDAPIKVDHNLYCRFWSLQDFFRTPNIFYGKTQWKMFQIHAETVLEAFASYKLEQPCLRKSSDKTQRSDSEMDIDLFDGPSCSKLSDTTANKYFAKYLTNPKLLTLELSDAGFRRAILVQFLIFFQYLQLDVKFKSDSQVLSSPQKDLIKKLEAQVLQLIEETPPNGKKFKEIVQHMLKREEMWNKWKNEGCKEIKKPSESTTGTEPSYVPPSEKNHLGDLLKEAAHNGKYYFSESVLTDLWNVAPDNLQACKSTTRNFLPPVEIFLGNPHEKADPAFEWRGLRLLARQSPHFFNFPITPTNKVSDYLEAVRKRIVKEKLDGFKTPHRPHTSHNNGRSSRSSKTVEPMEQESVALQETETVEVIDDDSQVDLDKVGEDERTSHSKPLTATRENIEDIAPLIGDHWKKLGKKLGFTPDELEFFETENKDRNGGCVAMLVNWFADDDDASLENWAYILEGLEINMAATAVKGLIARLAPKEKKIIEEIEVLSD